MQCSSCKYWARKGKKGLYGNCRLLSSLNGGIKSYIYKNRKEPCRIFDTKESFGCNNFIKLNGTKNRYSVTYFNDVISNNKSDYTVNVIVSAIDEIGAIKEAAITTDNLCNESDIINNIVGNKDYVIDILKQLGFHFKQVNLI